MKKNKKSLMNIGFLAPGLIIYIVFMVIPIALTFFYSFTNWNGLSKDFDIVGFANFKFLFKDAKFIAAIKTTLIITLVSTILVNVFGILFAVVLDTTGRLFKIGKAGIFIPAILSSVVVSFLWSYMTQTNGGIINTILNFIGFASVDFYSSNLSVTVLVSFVISWAALGFYTTVYDATLKTIPEELYEAAIVDGAGALQRFWKITMPLLVPGITINTILAITGGLKQYDFVKIMAPLRIETITVNAIQRAFEGNRLAYASTIVFVLFLSIVVVTVIQIVLVKRLEVEY